MGSLSNSLVNYTSSYYSRNQICWTAAAQIHFSFRIPAARFPFDIFLSSAFSSFAKWLTSHTQPAQALFSNMHSALSLCNTRQPTITTAINTRCTRLNECPGKWQNSLFCWSGDLLTKLDIARLVVGMCRVKPQGVGIPKIRDLGPSSGQVRHYIFGPFPACGLYDNVLLVHKGNIIMNLKHMIDHDT